MLIDHLTRLDKRSRNAVYLALLVIAGIAMYGWIVSPHVQYLQAVQKYRPAIDKIIDKQQDIRKTLVTRRVLLERLRKEFDAVSNTMHTAEQMQQLFGELGTVAEQYGCSLLQIDRSSHDPEVIIGEASDPTYVESVEAGLMLLGEYDSLVAFVDRLQTRERKVWISSIDIELPQDEILKEQDDVLKCDIVLEIYVIQKKEVAQND